MKIGILGTGIVGSNIGAKLVQLGYEVKMGSRTKNNEKAMEWAKKQGAKASSGTFEEAAAFGEIIFLCIKGESVLEVLSLAGEDHFKGKPVADITNPLDFSKGMPPSLFISNTMSLSEEIQKKLSDANIVKTLNIVNNEVMINPSMTGGEPTMFMSGNNSAAKEQIRKILEQFGWKDIIDLGDISGARGMEMLLPIWLRIWNTLQDGYVGFKIVRKGK